ncbi:MAG: hypothetical protein ACM3JG_04935, partial [Thiohalocapsa sp.]
VLNLKTIQKSLAQTQISLAADRSPPRHRHKLCRSAIPSAATALFGVSLATAVIIDKAGPWWGK